MGLISELRQHPQQKRTSCLQPYKYANSSASISQTWGSFGNDGVCIFLYPCMLGDGIRYDGMLASGLEFTSLSIFDRQRGNRPAMAPCQKMRKVFQSIGLGITNVEAEPIIMRAVALPKGGSLRQTPFRLQSRDYVVTMYVTNANKTSDNLDQSWSTYTSIDLAGLLEYHHTLVS